MTNRRKPSIKERRAVSVLTDALRAGSLRPSDQEAAAELLSRTLPDVARLQQHVIRLLATTALRQAVKSTSVNSSQSQPQTTSPSTDNQQQQSQLPPKQPPSPSFSSTDLLPSMRPRSLNSSSTPPANPLRKRRRTVRPNVSPSFSSSPSSTSFVLPRPSERFDHIGGINSILQTLRELVEWPLSRRSLYHHLGVDPPRGILLHGPPGCGKTLVAHAVAGELNVPFLRLSAPEIVSGVSGESERKLRFIFAQAVHMQPSIVFIDEIDAIASSRDGASKEMERRIVSQLLSCIDALSAPATPQKEQQKQQQLHSRQKQHQNGHCPQDEEEEKEDDIDSNSTMVAVAPNEGPSVDVTKAPIHDEEAEDESFGTGKPPAVVVIAATNRPESLEPALRRAGRFDKEIELGAPDEDGRRAILDKLCRRLRLDDSFDVKTVAKRTAGYVGADLHLLVKEAGLACIRRIVRLTEGRKPVSQRNDPPDVEMFDEPSGTSTFAEEEAALVTEGDEIESGGSVENALAKEEVEDDVEDEEFDLTDPNYSISMTDFEHGLDRIQPSAMREGFATRPNISWDKVGSLENVREEMIMAIVEPIRRPELFSSLGLHAAGGVLLYGPPGCGKTLLARAVASESGANFISVKGPELLSKYVGDSELAVRKLFTRARCSAPCVIFFDELDALAPRRGGGSDGGGGGRSDSSGASERVVNMLLTEMDGFNERKQVFLIAATNRPDIIDPAMLRPGRLDKLVFVPLPDSNGRVSILETLLKGVGVVEGLNVECIARDKRCEGFSGADLSALIRVAGESALREIVFGESLNAKRIVKIEQRHFERALKVVVPSVSPRDARSYQNMEKWLRKSRGHVRNESDEPRDKPRDNNQ